MRGRVEAWTDPPLDVCEALKPAQSRKTCNRSQDEESDHPFILKTDVPEAGFAGRGGGFRPESGVGRVAVPSG